RSLISCSRFSCFISSSSALCGSCSNAWLLGANTVYGPSPLNWSATSACSMALANAVSSGFFCTVSAMLAACAAAAAKLKGSAIAVAFRRLVLPDMILAAHQVGGWAAAALLRRRRFREASARGSHGLSRTTTAGGLGSAAKRASPPTQSGGAAKPGQTPRAPTWSGRDCVGYRSGSWRARLPQRARPGHNGDGERPIGDARLVSPPTCRSSTELPGHARYQPQRHARAAHQRPPVLRLGRARVRRARPVREWPRTVAHLQRVHRPDQRGPER